MFFRIVISVYCCAFLVSCGVQSQRSSVRVAPESAPAPATAPIPKQPKALPCRAADPNDLDGGITGTGHDEQDKCAGLSSELP